MIKDSTNGVGRHATTDRTCDQYEINSLRKLRRYVGNRCFERGSVTGNQLADEILAEVRERFMLLPTTADGKPIRPGHIVYAGAFPVEVSGVDEDGIFACVGDDHEGGELFGYGHATLYRSEPPEALDGILDELAHIDLADLEPGWIAEWCERVRKSVRAERRAGA